MAVEKRLRFIKKNINLFTRLLAVFALLDAVTAIVTFVLYGRARMQEEEQKEKLYLRVHYASLFILLLLGIVFMFFMVETET